MQVGDIVTVMTSLGTEFVGKLTSMDATMVVLSDPKLVSSSEAGLGFANGVAMTGRQDPKKLAINTPQVVFITETHDEVVKAWRQATSGIITP